MNDIEQEKKRIKKNRKEIRSVKDNKTKQN